MSSNAARHVPADELPRANREMAMEAIYDSWEACRNPNMKLTKNVVTIGTFKTSAMIAVLPGKMSVIKTIGANGENRKKGLPRAEISVEVRDPETNQRIGSIDGSDNNLARTAAVFLCIMEKFAGDAPKTFTIALFGTGPVNEKLLEFLSQDEDFTGIVRVHCKNGESHKALVAKFPDVRFTLEAADDNSKLHEARFIHMATSYANGDVFSKNEVADNAVILGSGGHEFEFEFLDQVAQNGGYLLVDDRERNAHRKNEDRQATQSIARWFEKKGLCLEKNGQDWGVKNLRDFDFAQRNPGLPVVINSIGDASPDGFLAIAQLRKRGFPI